VETTRRDMRRRFRQAASNSGSGRCGDYGYSCDEFYIDAAAIIESAGQAVEWHLRRQCASGS